MSVSLHQGDCLVTLRGMADNSVDSIVTDPPYGLSFMGKKWDYDVPSVEIWAECLRVLKPGGHLLAFAGTRTQHRMAVRIEDAGFEIRDMIMWTYASGFPKSLDVSKQIDKAAGHARATEYEPNHKNGTFGKGMGGGKHGAQSEPPITEAARQWQGWGTALKPALEPITMARKPLVGTVAANVLEHGTGALNIDGCRVEGTPAPTRFDPAKHGHEGWRMNATGAECAANASPLGRWPANLIHDGSEEVTDGFPVLKNAGSSRAAIRDAENAGIFGVAGGDGHRFGDTGSAARFFYCAKASKADREEGLDGAPDRVLAMSNQAKAELARGNMHEGESGMNTAKVRKNHHPTVKPTDLMAYLCRLVTPPGGVVLGPFMGSGSTGKAALREGFGFIGCEMSPEYMAIASARIEAALAELYV